MPKFAVYYATITEWYVEVEAESENEAHNVWKDEAYWECEPVPATEYYANEIDIVEIKNDNR